MSVCPNKIDGVFILSKKNSTSRRKVWLESEVQMTSTSYIWDYLPLNGLLSWTN